jgi:xanthine/uracil permease
VEPTLVTWLLIAFGGITLVPLLVAQSLMLVKPHSQEAKDILIARGEDWRDRTHFRFALGAAWADWLLLVPLLLGGSIGVAMGTAWGYVLWAAAGAISLYINVILWVTEKEYVYPSRGPLAYYSYYWGFFVYWGALALVYSAVRLSGVTL